MTDATVPAAPRGPGLAIASGHPKPALSLLDGVALVIAIVIGSAIFETPALVAANSATGFTLMMIWVLGAAISIVGALCWAELASAYPGAGGDYHYLTRAWGRPAGFFYAWARMTVIQTGSIALIAFVFGDYAAQLVDLGAHAPAIYAAVAVAVLTMLNLVGVRLSRPGQRVLTLAQLAGLAVLVAAGLFFATPAATPEATAPEGGGSFGLALVLVLLTYGGWNEAAFISAELRNPGRNMVRVLVSSIAVIAAIYLLVNGAMLRTLGLRGMSESDAVAAAVMRSATGEAGAVVVSLLVIACALASINAMIFTGARTSYALGCDFRIFRRLGAWEDGRSVPANAVLMQGVVVLLLIAFGAAQRNGFKAMVEYTAPVFWLFFLLTTIALLRLRRFDATRERPFTVPLYPVTPLLFAAVCAYLLYSSIVYTGIGSFVGLAVVAAGVPLFWAARRRGQGRA